MRVDNAQRINTPNAQHINHTHCRPECGIEWILIPINAADTRP